MSAPGDHESPPNAITAAHDADLVFLQLFMYEALGLCAEGDGGKLIESGEWITNRNGEMCHVHMQTYVRTMSHACVYMCMC